MPLTPDRYPGTRQEDSLLLNEDTVDPTFGGECKYVSGRHRRADTGGVFDPGLWGQEGVGAAAFLKPRQADGQGVKLYNAGGSDYVELKRGGGNFSISVGGSDAQAFYLNARIGQWQLGGTGSAQFFAVSNSGDGLIFKARADNYCEFNATLLPNGGTDTHDIGVSTNQFRQVNAQQHRVTNGLVVTRLANGLLQCSNATLNIQGGFGLTFRVTNVLGNSFARFVGNAANRYMEVRAHYGTGGGSTYVRAYHNGTDGYMGSQGGWLRMLAAAGAMVVPMRKDDPLLPPNGGIWYDEDADHWYRVVMDGEVSSLLSTGDSQFESWLPSKASPVGDDVLAIEDSAASYAKKKILISAVAPIVAPNHDKVIYVGKHGNDSNDGRTPAKAVLTFAQARILAAAQTPSNSNRWCIVCLDAGIYVESIAGLSYCDIWAPTANINGNHTLVDFADWKFNIIVATSGTALLKSSGVEITRVECNQLICTGSANGCVATAGALCMCSPFITVENGFGFGSTTTASIGLTFGQIFVQGTGTAIGMAGTGTGYVCAIGECIQDLGSGTGVAILSTSDGEINLTCNVLDCDTAYNVGVNGTLHFRSNRVDGNLSGSGTVRALVTEWLGGSFPTGTADPTGVSPNDGDRYFNTALGMWMRYDAGRSKWLSEDSLVIQVGSNTPIIAGGYYKTINGLLLSATKGFPAKHNGTVVAMGYTRAASTSATFEVTADGAGVAELASTATEGKSTALNGDFDEDEIIAARNKAGSNTTDDVAVWITLRWRA